MCRDLSAQLESRDLVVFLDYPSPDLLFCLDRHGWLFDAGGWTASDLFTAWREGAAVLVVPSSVPSDAIPRAIKDRSALVARSGYLAAYRLERFPGDVPATR
jgi:hypothetical protein